MKKRVAICMRGGVSKDSHEMASNKGDLYKEGVYVDYTKCYRSIVKHILAPNTEYEFDFFVHCWNVDLEHHISQLYHPKKQIFEDNSIYYDSLSKLIGSPDEFAGISAALSLKKSIEMKEEYEAENGIQYDLCICYRYDLFLWKDMVLDTYNELNAIYVNNWMDGNADFHFVMSNSISREFKNLYDSASKGNHVKVHSWIKNYIVSMGTQIIMDDIKPGEHHEVIRKIYECSIWPGHISTEAFLEY